MLFYNDAQCPVLLRIIVMYERLLYYSGHLVLGSPRLSSFHLQHAKDKQDTVT